MSLKETIDIDMKAAMKSGDKNRLTTIRAIRAALLEKEVSIRVGGKAELSDEQETEVLVSMAKRRRDSIVQFTEGNRPDLAANEEAELSVIEEYLPEPASDEEITTVVKEIIAATGASSMKDMGKVMGQAMKSLKGKADGTKVQNTVKTLLNP
ncbi:GatB/YqeY domain-containing protein [Chlorobium phaeovibrioides]|uniref:GatB/YqeY domain-containing protein n=2 Tax=Chlorobium phaeovibrioides TaxID=1094 RepID=A0A5M8IBS1_CHLPH|nr:GatB/YqeY domain-containing protein [Chlorobium phaeovibrioides]HCD36994.1 GatB/YqeY domain-containing protein [Chlorobium sp.]KAA6232843.1 GatB/YqeY domain-containing protein [Chlorobium phaeovibrioides]MWV54008.1 GatB/YqeY domain-containing protein [Chlorobium phaeovibrioides]QEQ56760.1 GatB/YqeY domain-containing protein [Chlorobium phaeovibrioides]RTY37195.1 GatB/YqeY domain-containing protein [Chlorobium phaeovibrioides]